MLLRISFIANNKVRPYRKVYDKSIFILYEEMCTMTTSTSSH